jgi:hypothetical protein
VKNIEIMPRLLLGTGDPTLVAIEYMTLGYVAQKYFGNHKELKFLACALVYEEIVRQANNTGTLGLMGSLNPKTTVAASSGRPAPAPTNPLKDEL